MESDGQIKITAFLLYDRSRFFSFLLLQHAFSYFFSVVIYNCRISFSLSPNLDDHDTIAVTILNFLIYISCTSS